MKTVVIGAAVSDTSSLATIIRAVVQCWQAQLADLLDPYRPELHYMRGPGPKWRQRHGLS
jgi:hypothetical protein